MKILFMGTPDFAKESLEELFKNNFEICGVVTQTDKPKGRGMKLIPCPVKEYALSKDIKVYQPEKISKNEEFKNEIKKLEPDVICVVAYGKILPKSFLSIPKKGCINVHPSLLPKYRGAAPIQWSILNGDKETGVTTMYMNEKMDEGDIILQERVKIEEDETTGDLWNRLSKIGASLLVDTIKMIEKGKIERIKQNDDYTIAPMIEKKDAKIDWDNMNVTKIKNLVRGLNPILGAYCFYKGKKIKFWKVQKLTINEFINIFKEFEEYSFKFKNMESGTVLYSSEKEGLYILGNEGIISVLEIQAENSKKMDILSFLRGNSVEVGTIFE
ncbi:MAG: methionyl-tRNA formyltransferase [Candidatus Scatovivens sp.]